MSDNDNWIRADQVYRLFDSYGKDRQAGYQQLKAGLDAGRIRAIAMDARLERFVGSGIRKSAERDWEVDPEAWPYGGNGPCVLNLESGSFSSTRGPKYWRVELTGLSFHQGDVISYVGLYGAGGNVIEGAAVRNDKAEKSAGGRTPDKEKWTNFAAAVLAHQYHAASFGEDIARGTYHKVIEDYAAQFGLAVPTVNTVGAAIDLAKTIVRQQHENGKPVDPPDLSETDY
jgi:hypothetical protein